MPAELLPHGEGRYAPYQLVEAALDALDARPNLAARWAADEAYRGMVEMLV